MLGSQSPRGKETRYLFLDALSYDHAFSGRTQGSIVVSVRRAAGGLDMVTITISDDGNGFKAKTESKRHGVGLMKRLVEQVRGTVIVNSEQGTVWTIGIPGDPVGAPSQISLA